MLLSIKTKIEEWLQQLLGDPIQVTVPEAVTFGHYSVNLMKLAKASGKSPKELGDFVIEKKDDLGIFEKAEFVNGFVNFWIKTEYLQKQLQELKNQENVNNENKGKEILIEYTDPNPFKEFHIGHLMTNTIGESLARLFEASGAKVLRVTWQGDVGMHIAMSVWALRKDLLDEAAKVDSLRDKMKLLGKAYAAGAKAFKEDPAAKAEIEFLNKCIYDRSDPEINRIYDLGRKWSLDYFETMYSRLGSSFVRYFFESEEGPKGLDLVRAHPEVFEESDGAIIFRGEKYGLHTRVFINKQGLPTYEAKELGLNWKKFQLYKPDISLIVTGNEINDYFKVLLKVMELIMPEVATKTKHIGHGMLRLPQGKMSSRTGDVISAESLIESIKSAVEEKIKNKEDLSELDREEIKEKVAISAMRYSILKQGIGKDIIFDIDTSIAFNGDSGPYLQYTYARLNKIVSKAGELGEINVAELNSEKEIELLLKLLNFRDEVSRATKNLSPNILANYLFELSNSANRFYESEPILSDENDGRRNARILLTDIAVRTLREGLYILGIEAPEKI